MPKWFKYENIWVRNIAFSFFLLLFILVQERFSPEVPDIPSLTFMQSVAYFFLNYGLIFLHNHFCVRLLFFQKKYLYYGLSLLPFAILLSWLVIDLEGPTSFKTPYAINFTSNILFLIFGAALYIANNWIITNLTKTKNELINREAELNFLKQQLSPHFLFNAINNLYGTALATPEIIPEKILELSDLLRYQIESTTKGQVNIGEEMTFVQNYLNYTNYKTNGLDLINKVQGEVKAYFLPPLLFLPLIENAVKYTTETENPFIHLEWIFEEKTFTFTIINSYLSEGSKQKGTKIGLENLQKRLEILNVKHEMSIDKSIKDVFNFKLKLWDLDSNA
jgi:two-component system, LytTR family, sensor kinase